MLKAAVVGVGAMGRNHVRVLMDLPDVELAAIVDRNPEATRDLVRRYGLRAFAEYREMLDTVKPEMVVLAAPTSLHCELTLAALERGVHVLVEKPIAGTVEEGRRMIDAAAAHGACLGVGHIERFNPAVIELKRRINQGELGKMFMIHSRRLSPYPRRIQDVGVAMDLATHELDMMRYLTGSEVTQLNAEVSQVLEHTPREDIVFGLLRFANGVLGILDVNWVTPTSVRELTITGERGMFMVNYLSQELFFYENPAAVGAIEGMVWDFTVQVGNMTRYQIARREPLRSQLESFIEAVKTGQKPLVDGEEGLQALSLARRVMEFRRGQGES